MCRRLDSPATRRLLWCAGACLALLLSAPAAAANTHDDGTDPCSVVPSWLQPACYLASAVSDSDGLIGGAISSGADSALRSIVDWVVGGAAWLLGQLVGLIESATRPDVTQGWFTVAYGDMVMIAGVLMLPLLLVSTIQAVLRQSAALLVKAAFVYVPVACIGMFAAVTVVDQLVIVTDELSAWVGRSTGHNLAEFATNVGEALVATGPATGSSSAAITLPGFATLLAAAVIGFASFVIWVLLVLRQAAIYVAVLFLPLAFASLVWPTTAHWLRRLLEGLVAIVMSKFVIVAVMGLASGALNAIGDEGFPVLISGGALLLLAAFAPFVLLRFIPVFESGLASQLDGTTTARTSPVPGPTAGGVYRGVQRARAASAARGVGVLAGVAGPAAVAGAALAASGGGAASTIARQSLAASAGAGGRPERVREAGEGATASAGPASGARAPGVGVDGPRSMAGASSGPGSGALRPTRVAGPGGAPHGPGAGSSGAHGAAGPADRAKLPGPPLPPPAPGRGED